MNDLVIFNITIPAWLYAPTIYLLWVSIFLLMKKILFSKIRKIAEKTRSQIDDILLDALNTPLTLFVYVSGAVLLERISPLGANGMLTKYFVLAFKITTVVAVIMFLDKLFRSLIKTYGEKVEVIKTSGGMAHGIIRVIV